MTTPDVIVRTAQEQDCATVAWLAALTFPLACPPGTTAATIAAHVASQLTPTHFVRWTRSPTHTLLVAEAETSDVPVGYALLVADEPSGALERQVLEQSAGSGPFVELSKIYVHPAHQGTGAAGLLMRSALESAPRLAPDAPVWLGTNGRNTRAQRFYRKHGFAVVGRRTYDVGGVQHDDVVMLHTAD